MRSEMRVLPIHTCSNHRLPVNLLESCAVERKLFDLTSHLSIHVESCDVNGLQKWRNKKCEERYLYS